MRPEAAFYHPQLGEFLLMYDAAREAENPAALILDFAQSSYEVGARLQGWPLAELELRPVGGERPAPTSHLAAAKAPNRAES